MNRTTVSTESIKDQPGTDEKDKGRKGQGNRPKIEIIITKIPTEILRPEKRTKL